jgi:hypothetical protein
MPLQAKHLVEEINGTRCTIVAKGATSERVAFLKDLLEFNNFEVMTAEEVKVNAEDPSVLTVGVTDLVFNPTIAVYELSLKTRDGSKVSPAYWDQKMTRIVDQYWLTEEETEPGNSAWFYPEN